MTTRHGFKAAKTSPEAKKRLACLKKAQSKKSKQSVSKTSPVGESRNKKTRSEKLVFQEPELSPMEKIQVKLFLETLVFFVK